jgi:phosphoacetylglucosamine mutase
MCCKLANPAVGDAIANFLLFELALHYLKFDYPATLKLYTDLKSKTSKIAVKNKEVLKVSEIEDKVVEPEGLQTEIEAITQKHKGKKAFLRASGTENVLRLHVEAETREQVEEITKDITKIVSENQMLN